MKDDSEVKIDFKEVDVSQGTTTRLEDVYGSIPTVSSAPTIVPKKIGEQFRVYSNGTTYRLYWYDFTNNAWRYTELATVISDHSALSNLTYATAGHTGFQKSVYTGYVNSDGSTGTPFPSGWSCSHTGSTGTYTITHNLGTSNYVALVCVVGNAYVGYVSTRGTNTLVVEIRSLVPSQVESDFMFTLIPT